MIQQTTVVEETQASVELSFETSDEAACLGCDRFNMVTSMVVGVHVGLAREDGRNIQITGRCHETIRAKGVCGMGALSIQHVTAS